MPNPQPNTQHSALKKMRHSTEHVLMHAMKNLGYKLHMAMGPATEDGFYFDFELLEGRISEEDFKKIQKEMQKIINKDILFERVGVNIKTARKLFKDNPYKQEWLDGIEKDGQQATLYLTGDKNQIENDKKMLKDSQSSILSLQSFVDLCSGPHVASTGKIGPFKLLSIAGAYWHGDENNKMLTRIYGTAFMNKSDLKDYLYMIEEAKKRDHRKIGKKLDLFTFDEELGQGLPLYMPKGALIRKSIIDFAFNTYLRKGYQPVSTPHIANVELWKRSGHWNFYRESMYSPMKIDDTEYVLKPMNCPAHIKIYKARPHSYKEFPVRYAEMGTVYRYEQSGELNGILRPRGFTQDDAHIICRPNQLDEELQSTIELTEHIYNAFGFEKPEVSLSVRDSQNKEKYLGKDHSWEQAEKALENALQLKNIPYKRFKGEAAFYGPKIDFMYKDALGRKQQLTTIQIDFNLPEKFDITYVGSDGEDHTPFMIHRALLGSIERFMGVYIEHTAGAFPVWLAPIQIAIIPITDEQQEYAKQLKDKLKKENIRVEVMNESESMQNKIRKAENQKVPYMLIVGKREVEKNQVSVRQRGQKNLGVMDRKDFFDRINKEVKEKTIW